MKRILALLVVVVLVAGLFVACGSSSSSSAGASSEAKYKDGTFEGQSKADERGNYGKVTITIKDGKITVADYKGYLKDGSVKDENYGKTSGDENYKKAQDALKGAATYGAKLVETQDVAKVDAVTGATSSHGQFVEAVNDALSKAAK